MEKKILDKEEIIKLCKGFDNELLKLYANMIDNSSTNYILLAKSLISMGNTDDEKIRKKQINLAIDVFEQGIEVAKESLKNADKFKRITYLNDIKIGYDYLFAIFFEDKYLTEDQKKISDLTINYKRKSNNKAISYLEDAYQYVPDACILYIILNYNNELFKRNIEKVKNGIDAIDLDKKYNILDNSEYLSILAGELITAKEDLKYPKLLCDLILKYDYNNEKACYFKAYCVKDSDEFNEYIELYKKLCMIKNVAILDPFELIK